MPEIPPIFISPESGDSKKLDGGKAPFHLIPARPLMEIAKTFGIGAAKYSPRAWEDNPIEWSRVFSAMQRHSWAFWNGEENDPVDGQSHLAAVAWCAMVLMEYVSKHPELDDRPDPQQEAS